MVTKTFCDMCDKEIPNASLDLFNFRMENSPIYTINLNRYKSTVCPKCSKKIIAFIERGEK